MSFGCAFGLHDPEPLGKTQYGTPIERCRRCDKRRHYLGLFGNWSRWHPQSWFDRLEWEVDEDRRFREEWPS